MNKTRDRLDRLIRRVRALRADADRLRPYALDVASKAAEVCVQSYHLRNEARTLVSQMVSHKFTLACSLPRVAGSCRRKIEMSPRAQKAIYINSPEEFVRFRISPVSGPSTERELSLTQDPVMPPAPAALLTRGGVTDLRGAVVRRGGGR
jgi:hypothetical protein